jgi:hypothetical protein
MLGSAEFILGIALIIGALALGWSARLGVTGPVRRIAMMPVVEDYFVIVLLIAIVAGGVLIATAVGAT